MSDVLRAFDAPQLKQDEQLCCCLFLQVPQIVLVNNLKK